MTERGVVTKVKGGRATVEFDRKSACDSCHMCAVTKDGMKVKIVIENTLNAAVGDVVTVSMGERFVLTAALIVYIIPLVLVGIGVGVGSLLTELAQVLLAVGVALLIQSSISCSDFLAQPKIGWRGTARTSEQEISDDCVQAERRQ